MADTIFSKIIAGDIPCHRVYENEHTLAFLDIGPLSRGHTLVIPKEPADRVENLSDDASAALGRALPRITRAVCAAVGADSCNILINNGPRAGQEVMHVHIHVIPRFPDRPEGAGLEKRWNGAQAPADIAELADDIARRVAD